MAITVIYGAQCTGKTFHAEAFRQHYGCTRIIDGYMEGDAAPRPSDGDLVLTSLTPQEMRQKRYRGTFDVPPTLVSIEVARAAIGVGPVQPLAVWRYDPAFKMDVTTNTRPSLTRSRQSVGRLSRPATLFAAVAIGTIAAILVPQRGRITAILRRGITGTKAA